MTAEESMDAADGRRAIDRRTMLKAAVATGVVAGTWVAPRIESFGFAPAAAIGTPCVILSASSDDKNLQSGQNYCPIVTEPCCGASFGNAGQVDRFAFTNPVADCSQIVVRTIALNCNAGTGSPERNPDVGQFAVVIESTTGSGCSNCRVKDAVIIDSTHRTVLGAPLDNGPVGCLGGGVDASVACNDTRLVSSSRLAVRLTCNVVVGGCTPQG